MSTTSEQAERVYAFDEFRLDAAERVLTRGGAAVALTPKAFDTLLVLVRNGGRLVEKARLLDEVWPGTFVEEKTLAQNVFLLRKTLGTDPAGGQYIQTVPRHGYRFVADVRVARREDGEGGAGVHEAFAPRPPHGGVPPESKRTRAATRRGGAEIFHGLLRSCRRWVVFLLAGLAAAAGVLFGLRDGAADRFQRMKIANLTAQGGSRHAAISPDGNYVAVVVSEAGRESLRVRQVVTANELQIVAPAEGQYLGLTFSPDGNYIFYALYERGEKFGVLRRVPVLGGVPSRVVQDVDSPVAFSPDGRRLAFIRNYFEPAGWVTELFVADADGTGERRLATRRGTELYMGVGPAWSPDGRVIACALADVSSREYNVVGVAVSDGAERPLSDCRWARVVALAWPADGGGLLVNAFERNSQPGSQIWRVEYPGGETRRMTNDLNLYRGLSLTADARSLVTVQSDRYTNLWVSNDGDPRHAEQVKFTPGGRFGSIVGLSWTPDGRIVYASNESGNYDIWLAGAEGGGRKQLTVDALTDHSPAVSPDGGRVAFVSDRTGRQRVWVMDIDGGNQTPLSPGDVRDRPRWSPDGRWLVYTTTDSALWKIPAAGGEPVRLTDLDARTPAVSPDGRLVSFEHWDSETTRRSLMVVPLEGGEATQVLDVAPGGLWASQWTPDGSALRFIDERDGVSNIWLQSLDGGAPRRLTELQSGFLTDFVWSPRDERLVYASGVMVNDVVLISDFR
ncbi:MAG TPA: winged helix-turn-helix domain-containing protein [Pyrinomonadaceae bacterium]|jgi:Tol biopolymer transport system component/DNA-binding winged helix-turn-helix (wHTH) protein